MSRVHIIGAGLAGLSAAVRLAAKGAAITLYEQAAQTGGRARSFHDAQLDRLIDNGNHLLLSGNRSTLDYLSIIGADDELTGPDRAVFSFRDLETDERWTIDLNRGPVPLWTLYKDRRVPGTSLADYLAGLKLLTAGDRSVAALFAEQGQIYRRFWEPFSVAVLNTPPEEAAARLLTPVIRETLAKGADASRPLIARRGLSETFVTPALKFLESRSADIRIGKRVTGLAFDNRGVTVLQFSNGVESVDAGDTVILAVPPWIAGELIADLVVPQSFEPIVNVHYRLPGTLTNGGPRPSILGVIGGTAQWLFRRGDIVSVTISAARREAGESAEAIGKRVWRDVARALDLADAPCPAVRVVKERRATFSATPAELARRPAARTQWRNLVLAGDWTATGLPATIEGAIRSGDTAAQHVLVGSS